MDRGEPETHRMDHDHDKGEDEAQRIELAEARGARMTKVGDEGKVISNYRIIYIMTNIDIYAISINYQVIMIFDFISAMSLRPRSVSAAGRPKVINTPSFGLPGLEITRSKTVLGPLSPRLGGAFS